VLHFSGPNEKGLFLKGGKGAKGKGKDMKRKIFWMSQVALGAVTIT